MEREVRKILSFDPGACDMGVAEQFSDGTILTTHVRLIPEEMNFRQFKKKYGPNTELILMRNTVNFLEDYTMNGTAKLIIIETQSLSFTHAITSSIVTYFESMRGPRIVFVHPYSISRHFKIGGLTRTERKKRIREILGEHYWENDLKRFSQDEIDAVFNIFYFERIQDKKKKTPELPCPTYQSSSRSLARPSPLTARPSASTTSSSTSSKGSALPRANRPSS